MAILVTGGTGYIGSHTVVELLDLNQRIVEVASMLSNGNVSDASLKYAEELLKNK